ncbi:MAG: iron-sulfur cluster assembly protein, partial [Actinomycetota bacterium]
MSAVARESDVQAALAGVEEPELALPMVALGMVKGVAVDGSTAVVAVALPLAGAERAEAVHCAVADAVLAATDLDRVEVDLREMTPEELAACARVLKHEPPPNPLKIVDANAPARPEPRVNPFTDAATRVIAVSSG